MTDTWYDPMHPVKEDPSIWQMVLVGAGLFFAVALLLPAFALASVVWMSRPPSQIEFDAATWRESPGETVRWRMHEDLLESAQLEGRTVYEVLDLLGPPRGDRASDGSRLEYSMGIEQDALFRVDGVWFLIDFDPDGVVQRQHVATQ